MTKDRIVFFANGDFAIDTFETLVNNGSNIVGLVTCANDKVKFHNRTIREVAEDLRVPYYMIKGEKFEEDDFFIDWLKRMDADIFCVISFKKLPRKIINLAKKCAFNVHASLLPFLRGAAPINWAIRLGYKETGLTAFVLSDKIDQGDIIANTKVKITPGEKYTTLYKKLSDACVDFTGHVIEDVLQHEDWKECLIAQPSWSDRHEYIHTAEKINSRYFSCRWSGFKCESMQLLVNSVDDIGLPCIIYVIDEDGKEKKFDAKIYEVEVADKEKTPIDVQTLYCESDGKTFVRLNLEDVGKCVYIKRIQLAGKKIMNIEDFLNGFRYFRENKSVIITDLMLEDYE
jgi:methionyl-tRNA formyltransferase